MRERETRPSPSAGQTTTRSGSERRENLKDQRGTPEELQSFPDRGADRGGGRQKSERRSVRGSKELKKRNSHRSERRDQNIVDFRGDRSSGGRAVVAQEVERSNSGGRAV
ncbi:Hypothetical predicted protein [Xyrichtys novacula]|nr:Hypothetical predicted protein [Xyrichtys novacula]CAJ1087787.1 Hypothetical predicted protein [Xyrichtys novacula]